MKAGRRSPKIRIDGARVLCELEGVGTADPLTLELEPSSTRYRKKRSWWRVKGTSRWHLSPGLAVAWWERQNGAP